MTHAGYPLDAKAIIASKTTESPAKPTKRTFRRLDSGVEDALSNGITRAPHEGHIDAVSSIGSTQRQHDLVIRMSSLQSGFSAHQTM
jgi:hypothetical protein